MKKLIGDGLLALVLAGVGLAGTHTAGLRTATDQPADARAYALVVVAAFVLVGRRRRPIATLAVTTVATSAYLVLGYPYGPILLSFLAAVYTVARHLPLRPAAVACALSLPLLLIHVFTNDAPGLVGLVPGSAWVVVPFAVGATVRLSRESADRARIELARQHADEERLRVAQEVHDVVGHGLSAINMQAEIALHLLAKRPEQAQVALKAISRTSREALDELRATLAVVRSEGRAPLPGLARLDDLVDRMIQMGVPVQLHTDGRPHPLPASVDLAAYRIVQESLTNVLRHAGPAAAVVRLGYGPGEVTVEVTDAGAGGRTAFQAGHGIAGMRERVTALAGTFAAGPLDGGGFRVHARLPLP